MNFAYFYFNIWSHLWLLMLKLCNVLGSIGTTYANQSQIEILNDFLFQLVFCFWESSKFSFAPDRRSTVLWRNPGPLQL